MKLTASLVFPLLFAAAYGAAGKPHLHDGNEDEMASEYRSWDRFPWDRPGNPPPIFPPDDFTVSRIGRLRKPSRGALNDHEGDDSDEYRIWGKFPWERPNNPTPFVPPSDTVAFSQIGRWWNQDYLAGKPDMPARSARYSSLHDVGDKSEEYRIWGKFPWERPQNPPPFVPPSDIRPYSQIGRWWNQDYLAGKPDMPARSARYSSEDDVGDNSEEYRIWGKFPWERPQNPPPFVPPSDIMAFSQIGRWWNQDYLAGKPDMPVRFARHSGNDDVEQNTAEKIGEPLTTSKDQKHSRIPRSIWHPKPWEKPWNPPPFLPDVFPRPH